MTPTLSVIIPTMGRETLRDTLQSVAAQGLGASDEVLVLSDGPQPGAERIIAEMALPQARYTELPKTGNWGQVQRNTGMAQARGDFILFMDDDDVYLPGAFDVIRRNIERYGRVPFMYRIIFHDGLLLWVEPEVKETEVSTEMIVVPRDARLGTWTARREGDYDFIAETLGRWNGATVWRPEVLGTLRYRWDDVKGKKSEPIFPIEKRQSQMLVTQMPSGVDVVYFGSGNDLRQAKLLQDYRRNPLMHDCYTDYHRVQIETWLWSHREEMGPLVLDIGVLDRRDWAGRDYYTVGLHGEDIHGDVTALDLPDNHADTVICTEVLEHVADPFKAVKELYRVLKPGGRIFASAPFWWTEHGCEDYADYWRFTEQGWRLLLQEFKNVQIRQSHWAIESQVMIDMVRRFEGMAQIADFSCTTGYLCSATKGE